MDSKKLQDFADTLRMVNANKSGNAQGVAFYSNQIKQRQLEEQAKLKKLADQKKRDDFYNSLNANQKMIFDMKEGGMPDSYIKSQFYADPKKRDSYVAKDGYRYYVDGKQERVFPGVTVTETQSQEDIYKENAARIKNTILTKGVDSLTENEKLFYNDYIKRTGGNPFNQVMADMFVDNNPGTKRNKPKSYKVINNSYGNASAESIIKQAMELNNNLTREDVIRNLIANNIIAE